MHVMVHLLLIIGHLVKGREKVKTNKADLVDRSY